MIEEAPCEACITGDVSRPSASGSLPRTEGLIFLELDIWHYKKKFSIFKNLLQ